MAKSINITNDIIDNQNIRSLKDEKFAVITFESHTNRDINVYWVDYSGKVVLYTTLEGGGTFNISTFETHPWIFRDAENNRMLLADGEEVFYPVAWDGRERPNVQIHIPVYSLRDLCIEQIKRTLKGAEEIKDLDIPRSLISELLYREKFSYTVHMEF